jgi:hypothetical protein
MKDQFTVCSVCKSKLCYQQMISASEFTKTCFSCGMTTTSHTTSGSEQDVKIMNQAPELYKDLRVVDSDGLAWYPATISLPEKGMVFLEGRNASEAVWVAVKQVPVPKSEAKKFKGQSHKMDMKNAIRFKRDEYTEALNAIDFFG